MNDRLIAILSERRDFSLSAEDKKLLDVFAEYLDHGSLFLSGYEAGNDPLFVFTNDAQRYRFRMSEIREHLRGMQRGEAMRWEQIPYESMEESR